MADCTAGDGDCRDTALALKLKFGAIAVILAACLAGVGMPLLGRSFSTFFRPESNLFFLVKAFAAGVILATAFVHMLPDTFQSLTHDCLSHNPWAKFPFAGFVSMLSALLALFIESLTSSYYKKRHISSQNKRAEAGHAGVVSSPIIAHDDFTVKKLGERELIAERVPVQATVMANHGAQVGTAASSHNTNPLTVTFPAHETSYEISQLPHPDLDHDDHIHGHDIHGNSVELSQLRYRVIAQVLEVGVIAHSVIIGITLGTSQSPCTIRPLLAALTFHQFFEGTALGGCIAQAGYGREASALMAGLFAGTAPAGIAIGMAIAWNYNANSSQALIVQGLFDSMSAGILVYMSLVDLIAADFLSERLQGDVRLQLYSYSALFLGAAAMSFLAYWA